MVVGSSLPTTSATMPSVRVSQPDSVSQVVSSVADSGR
jgi:hypothetical protein